MAFPDTRPRRLRRSPVLRAAVRETSLEPANLVLPLFVAEAIEGPVPIASLPGHCHHTVESSVREAEEAARLGIPMVLLFGLPAAKDQQGSSGWDPNGAVQQATRAIKDRLGDRVLVATDVCLCEYTDHGHCGILAGETVDNDATLEAYSLVALSHAVAGADIVAPRG